MYLRLSPYREILQGIQTDLEVNEGIIKLIGKSGAGKTALCSQLFHELEEQGQEAVFFLKAPASPEELQNSILKHLNLNLAGNFTKVLTNYLLSKPGERRRLVLIFDDAHDIDVRTFTSIRMLCNIQDDTHALIRTIICGTEELDRKLAAPDFRALTQFLSQSFTLPYLTMDEVNDFCHGYWLALASDMKPLKPKALHKLYNETQGHPGILQARLNQGNTGAESNEKAREERALAGQKIRNGKYSEQRPDWVPALMIVAGLLLIGGTGGYWYVTNRPAASAATALPVSPALSVAPAPVANTEVTAAEALVPAPEVEADETRSVAGEAAALATAGDLIEGWTASWQGRDVDTYLAYYHPAFSPPQGASLEEWQAQRRRAITNASDIAITVEEPFEVVNSSGTVQTLRFWLRYSAGTYADNTLKELQLQLVDGQWRIREERNLLVERQ
jgi:general secretion pathway protein A